MHRTIAATLAWASKNTHHPRQQQDAYTKVYGDDPTDTPVDDDDDGHDYLTPTGTPPPSQARRRSTKPCVAAAGWLVAALVTASVLVLGFLALLALLGPRGGGGGGQASLPPPPGPFDEKPCGNSSAEALARGCVFDTMLYGWMHPRCFDEALMRQYLDAGRYTWRDDPAHEALMPDISLVGVSGKERATRGLWAAAAAPTITGDSAAIAAEGGHWVPRWEFHLVHCVYTWELMERAYARGGDDDDSGWVIRELTGEGGAEHAGHCGARVAVAARQGLDDEAKAFIQTKSKVGPPLYFTCAKPGQR